MGLVVGGRWAAPCSSRLAHPTLCVPRSVWGLLKLHPARSLAGPTVCLLLPPSAPTPTPRRCCWPQVWDPERVVIIPDHYIFTSDPRANRNVDILRDMAARYGIKYFYDIQDRANFRANPDYKGVCHVALAQEGHCKPGAGGGEGGPGRCLAHGGGG